VEEAVLSPIQGIVDDRECVEPGERVLLIVDNDPAFAQLLVGVTREEGWKAIAAVSGASAVALAREYEPSAITLDIRLPDIDGLRVLRVLKADANTRHIPVQVISTEEEEDLAHSLGAWAYLRKPIVERELLVDAIHELRVYAERASRDLLLVAGEDAAGELLARITGDLEVRATAASGLEDALSLAEEMQFDCIVVDSSISSGPCVEVAEELAQRAQARNPQGRSTRVLVHLRNSPQDDRDIRESSAVLVVRTLPTLLSAVAQTLNRRVDALPPHTRGMIESLEADDQILPGRRILIVDDDVRNIFALTSVLEKQGMDVSSAETGQAALDLLQTEAPVDAVLMDIMMPGMDGFDTIRAIRALPERRAVPIIAVTAKAMKGDRERTLEAGAWDYLSKPVDTDQMLRVLRVWLKS
jgi:CheY-like chemotaxis protein